MRLLIVCVALLFLPVAQADPVEPTGDADGYPVALSATGDATCPGAAGCVVVAGDEASCGGYCVAAAGDSATCQFTCVAVAGNHASGSVAADPDSAKACTIETCVFAGAQGVQACVLAECVVQEGQTVRTCPPLVCVSAGPGGFMVCAAVCVIRDSAGMRVCDAGSCTTISVGLLTALAEQTVAATLATAQEEFEALRNWETTCNFAACVRGSGATQAEFVAVGPHATGEAAVATSGDANGGTLGVSRNGHGHGLVGLGSQSCNGKSCYRVGPNANADYVAVGTGSATSRGVAAGTTGATGAVAFSPTGDASGLVAASLTGDASCTSLCVAATIMGDTSCTGFCAGVSGPGLVQTVVGLPGYAYQVWENTTDSLWVFLYQAERNTEKFIEDNVPLP